MEFEERLEDTEGFLDGIEAEEDTGDDVDEALIQEREMLEEMPLPGRTVEEADRKRKWLVLPRPARAATQRMHNNFGHKLKGPLIELLKASNAPQEGKKESCAWPPMDPFGNRTKLVELE